METVVNIISFLVFIAIIGGILYIRLKNIGKRQVVKGRGFKIFAPLIFVLPMLFFVFQGVSHLNYLFVVLFVLIGMLLSIPLIKFVSYEFDKDTNEIYLKRDRRMIVFIFIIIAFKLSLRYVFQDIPEQQLSALLYVMGVTTLLLWVTISYNRFLKLKRRKQEITS